MAGGAATRNPSILWGQQGNSVLLTVTFSDATYSQIKKCLFVDISESEFVCRLNFTDDNESKQPRPTDYNAHLTLKDQVIPEQSFWYVKESSNCVKVKLAKRNPQRRWAKLCEENLPSVKVDWLLWEAFDSAGAADEESRSMRDTQGMGGEQGHDVKQLLVDNVPFSAADKQSLDDAPDIDTSEALDYFCEKMTTPQRMLTMLYIWNASKDEEKKSLMGELVTQTSVDVSQHIKGGGESLQQLATEQYEDLDVVGCSHWVEQYKLMTASEERVKCLGLLFSKLSDVDKQLVLSAFV